MKTILQWAASSSYRFNCNCNWVTPHKVIKKLYCNFCMEKLLYLVVQLWRNVILPPLTKTLSISNYDIKLPYSLHLCEKIRIYSMWSFHVSLNLFRPTARKKLTEIGCTQLVWKEVKTFFIHDLTFTVKRSQQCMSCLNFLKRHLVHRFLKILGTTWSALANAIVGLDSKIKILVTIRSLLYNSQQLSNKTQ